MIEFSDTIADPGTVVIHSLNALFADRAMVYSLFFDDITFEAIADFVEEFDLFSEDMDECYRLGLPFTLFLRHTFFI